MQWNTITIVIIKNVKNHLFSTNAYQYKLYKSCYSITIMLFFNLFGLIIQSLLNEFDESSYLIGYSINKQYLKTFKNQLIIMFVNDENIHIKSSNKLFCWSEICSPNSSYFTFHFYGKQFPTSLWIENKQNSIKNKHMCYTSLRKLIPQRKNAEGSCSEFSLWLDSEMLEKQIEFIHF